MALRMGALYDALKQAPGVTEDAARNAAEEVANYDNRMAKIEADLRIVQWMLGVVLLLLIGLFWQGFMIMGRLP